MLTLLGQAAVKLGCASIAAASPMTAMTVAVGRRMAFSVAASHDDVNGLPVEKCGNLSQHPPSVTLTRARVAGLAAVLRLHRQGAGICPVSGRAGEGTVMPTIRSH